MILHDAVKKLEDVSSGMGTEDGDLRYMAKPHGEVCRLCSGECMAVEFGGRVAEVSTPVPFTACMKLENIFGAPLKSPKTRAAAAGALTAASGFLMFTRKTGPCDSLMADDCREELAVHCSSKKVYVLGKDIPGLSQTLTMDEADIVLVTGDALLDDDSLAEIDEAQSAGKELLFVGPSCAGVASLLQKPFWCPYGT